MSPGSEALSAKLFLSDYHRQFYLFVVGRCWMRPGPWQRRDHDAVATLLIIDTDIVAPIYNYKVKRRTASWDQTGNCLGDAGLCNAGQSGDQYSQRNKVKRRTASGRPDGELSRRCAAVWRGPIIGVWLEPASCSRSEPRSAVISLCFARVNTRQISHPSPSRGSPARARSEPRPVINL